MSLNLHVCHCQHRQLQHAIPPVQKGKLACTGAIPRDLDASAGTIAFRMITQRRNQKHLCATQHAKREKLAFVNAVGLATATFAAIAAMRRLLQDQQHSHPRKNPDAIQHARREKVAPTNVAGVAMATFAATTVSPTSMPNPCTRMYVIRIRAKRAKNAWLTITARLGIKVALPIRRTTAFPAMNSDRHMAT
jgi:hypothetical protein